MLAVGWKLGFVRFVPYRQEGCQNHSAVIVTAGPYRRTMTTTLRDLIDLALEVGPPVEAGALRLFPLFSASPAAAPYLCGPEAEASGALLVKEHDGGGSVPELILTSSATLPLLLLEGETVLGAKQNRTLNVSVLCHPGVPTPIPVSCVEAGRWGAPQRVSRSPHHAPAQLRAHKTRSVVDSVRRAASKRSDQGLVWETVAGYSARLEAPSPTSALEDVAAAAAPDVAALVAGLRPLDGQRGVLMVSGSGVVALDLFDKPSTLATYWDGLISGYALDGLHGEAPAFTTSDADAFLARLLQSTATEAPAVGAGRELHLGDDDLTGGALVWDDAVVHLAAFASAPGR
jgi:hypothetical protein